jgi:hypothetical protein
MASPGIVEDGELLVWLSTLSTSGAERRRGGVATAAKAAGAGGAIRPANGLGSLADSAKRPFSLNMLTEDCPALGQS